MVYQGHVENDVIVLDAPTSLPNGAKVEVSVVSRPPADKHRAIELMEQWAAEDDGYDAEVLAELKSNLDRSRQEVGARRLFDE